jgi:hypothetical protein
MNSTALKAGNGSGNGPGKPAKRPWQNLYFFYFFPLLHGQGWLRPTLAIGVQVFVAALKQHRVRVLQTARKWPEIAGRNSVAIAKPP